MAKRAAVQAGIVHFFRIFWCTDDKVRNLCVFNVADFFEIIKFSVIDAFSKFAIEAEFQALSPGGKISYVEIPNMNHNLEALEELVKFIYDNIQYAEFNTKSDYCHVCGFDGEMKLNDKMQWYCDNCGNMDPAKLTVIRRTCGYLGENYWNCATF